MTQPLNIVSMRVQVEDALALLALPEADASPRFYWSAPRTGESIAAFGASHVASASGPGRLAVVAREVREARRRLSGGGDSVAPRWVGGFAFEDGPGQDTAWQGFEPAGFVLPWATVVATSEGATLTVSGTADEAALARRARGLADRLVRSGYAPPHAGPATRATDPSPAWSLVAGEASEARLRERLQAALAAIAAGDVEKVVVAARRTVRAPHAPDPLRLVATLRVRQPDSYNFMVSPQAGSAFVGATPERLVRVAGERLESVALAGTAERATDPDEDQRLARSMLQSPKVRREHDLVVRTVRQALEDAGYALSPLRAPVVRRLATVQHLETPIRARAGRQLDVLIEAERLHPTPALGGSPRDAARHLIASLEEGPRGWFGGGVGWADGSGDGEIAVAIRSLLIRGATVTSYAGAGIVAGSDPEAEAAEIRLKLASALEALEP